MDSLDQRIQQFRQDAGKYSAPYYDKNVGSLLPKPEEQNTVSNSMADWVRGLPQGLSDAGLNTYVYSNPDFGNDKTRQAAFDFYKELYTLPEPEPSASNGGYGNKYYDVYKWARKIYDRKNTAYPDKVEEIKKYLAAQDETDLTDDGIISIYKNLGLI